MDAFDFLQPGIKNIVASEFDLCIGKDNCLLQFFRGDCLSLFAFMKFKHEGEGC